MRSGLKAALLGLASGLGFAMGHAGNIEPKRPAAPRKLPATTRTKPPMHVTEQQKVINRMTNWQRNQWGKAGHSMKMKDLEHFANLEHWKKAA